jgi:peptide/nickel transport system permease protein
LAKRILKKLLHLLFLLVALSLLTFLLVYLAPGDAAARKLGAQGVAVSQEVLEQTRAKLGLDRPFLVQYGDWALGLLRGDLGLSLKDGLPVADKLGKALRYTLLLAAGSLGLALLIALPLSFFTALRQDSLPDYALRFLSFVGNSLPNFLISVLLMYFLCVRARLLPVVAEENLRGLLLPCLALAIPLCGRFLRQFRAELLERLSAPYVRGALARGVKKRTILLRDVMRNSAAGMLTVIGLSVGTLLGGSVVIETIFRWPGLGKLVMDAITARDFPVIQGFVLFSGVVCVGIDLLLDLCYRALDPRIRKEGR